MRLDGNYIANGRGRSLGGYLSDVFQARHLILHLAGGQLRDQYRRSFLGTFWEILNPIFLALIFGLIFGRLFGQANLPQYIAYVLLGITIYDYFGGALSTAGSSILMAESLMKQAKIPSVVFPIKSLLFLAIRFGYGLIGYIVVAAVVHQFSWIGLVWLPVCFLIWTAFLIPIAILSSIATMWFGDYQAVIRYVVLILYYVSPVFVIRSAYDRPELRLFTALNPVRAGLDMFRAPMLYGHAPAFGDIANLLIWTVGLGLAAAVWLWREEDKLVLRY